MENYELVLKAIRKIFDKKNTPWIDIRDCGDYCRATLDSTGFLTHREAEALARFLGVNIEIDVDD